jgi:hypothetical protein
VDIFHAIITYMYWNNPTIELTYPSDQDPVAQSLHGGTHCVFWDPAITKTHIHYQQSLQDICDWANRQINNQGLHGFINDRLNHYDIANLVKLNMWVDDIRQQGIVKPMNLYYRGPGQYGINNGESRLRALERINSIVAVSGFIGCRAEHADNFKHLESVTTFKQFAELCGAEPGQQFLFTLTDPTAPYGIFWYEYNSRRTTRVTPGESYCVQALHTYLTQHPDMIFTPEWFDTLIVWNNYTK